VRRRRLTSAAEKIELTALRSPVVVTDPALEELVRAAATARALAKDYVGDAEAAAKALRSAMEDRGYGILNVPHYKVSLTPITRKPTIDYANAFEALCAQKELEQEEKEFILSNNMKDGATSYRLDIKETE